MLYGICIKSYVKVLYFIFIFISSSVPRFSMKKSVNQLKNKRPYLCTFNGIWSNNKKNVSYH